MPLGKEVVVIANPVVMVILSACCTLCCGVPESLAVTVKFEVPAAVGVPEIAPAVLMVNPAGKEPLVTLRVMAPTPPLVCTLAV